MSKQLLPEDSRKKVEGDGALVCNVVFILGSGLVVISIMIVQK